VGFCSCTDLSGNVVFPGDLDEARIYRRIVK